MFTTISRNAFRPKGVTAVLLASTRKGPECSALSPRYYSALTTSSAAENPGPLKGIRIIDLSRVLAAPFCTQILGDYGADVIKVEAIGKGDDTRHWKMPGEDVVWKEDTGPMSTYFTAINRNKKSVTLNLKNQKGKEILRSLVKNADVLIENFKPGTMDRLQLGYDSLKEINPKLIYASVSGYGTTGPFAPRGGYDPIAAAEAGLMHITGERNGPPVRTGLGLVDMATGLYIHGAISAALYSRTFTGRGQRIDASLFETQLSLLVNVGLTWLNLGVEAERWGNQHPSIVPMDAFRTKDMYLVCAATNDAQYATMCKLLGLDNLITDERFITNPKRVANRDILTPILNEVFRTKTTDEWINIFTGAGLAFAPINNMERTFSHPQTAARSMVADIAFGPRKSERHKLIAPAVKFSETVATIRSEPPRLGQHTQEVLKEHGYSPDEIAALREEGAV